MNERIGCHFCDRFTGRSLSEVWAHEEAAHPDERAREDAELEKRPEFNYCHPRVAHLRAVRDHEARLINARRNAG